MTAHRVLGLDLSITATGVCLPDGTTYTVGGDAPLGDRRLVTISHRIALDCQRHHVTLAVLEDLPVHGKSAGITGMVQGVVRYALCLLNIPVALIPAATLKAYATGSGRAEKADMKVAAYKRAQVEFADDNQCDAWWLRHAGLDWLGDPPFTLPKGQHARLDKGKWPAGLSRKELS